MANSVKIIRDPLYNYISIEEPWLIELINAREFQRLRRIRQLGISHITYPGAEHTRLSHTLSVLHLMLMVLRRLESSTDGPRVEQAKAPLLAAALLHDIGHGPYSHLFEPLLKTKPSPNQEASTDNKEKHEMWSCKIIQDETTEVNAVLKRHEVPIDHIISLIEEKDRQKPPWQKALLSSELDVDRLDYLRRDSYFSGAGYGHFDWYRIVNSVSLADSAHGKVLVWPDSAKYAIEEYIFARFYMYQNVYQHKTTRGFEKLIHAAWHRAEALEKSGSNAGFVKELNEFRSASKPTVQQYLELEDGVLLYQIKNWCNHPDKTLSDLSQRIIVRKRFKHIDDPVSETEIADAREKWEKALQDLAVNKGYTEPEYYALCDDRLKQTIYNPYAPEKEKLEQDPYNAILIQTSNGPTEISDVLDRLKPVVGKQPGRYRYYVPEDIASEAKALATSNSWR